MKCTCKFYGHITAVCLLLAACTPTAAVTEVPVPTAINQAAVQPTVIPTIQPTPPVPTATSVTIPQPVLEGKLVKLDDGYLILAAIKRDPQTQTSDYTFSLNRQTAQLTDAAGVDILIEPLDRFQIDQNAIMPDWIDYVLYRTHTTQVKEPLTLTFPTLIRGMSNFGDSAKFSINLGKDIQADKTLPVDARMDFVTGHPFLLKTISLYANLYPGNPNKLHASFNFKGPEFEGIVVEQLNLPLAAPGGGGGGTEGSNCDAFPGCFYAETDLLTSPDGIIPMQVVGLVYAEKGPWSIIFNTDDANN